MHKKCKYKHNSLTSKNNPRLVDLVSLFNDILTFVHYLKPKSSFLKDNSNSNTIQPIATGIRGFIPFSRVLVKSERNSKTEVGTYLI